MMICAREKESKEGKLCVCVCVCVRQFTQVSSEGLKVTFE
jgi:hypothetical protein